VSGKTGNPERRLPKSNPGKLMPGWQPGQSGNPAGRAIGARSKLTEKFLTALHDSFEKYGAEVIDQVRAEQPAVYLKIIAAVIPRELRVAATSPLQDVTDEQLTAILDAVRRQLLARAGSSSSEGSEAPPRVN
jgi:hypothetical protein